ncbi:MAG TPA: tRNA (adenosine(37)-N6)-threonylcarbamoyltransferase complex dimerization subunit type 1 TsaB [Pyrinomonadaceae bacterium]
MRPLILSVETATLAGSISLACEEEILSRLSGDSHTSHSNTLLHDIDGILSEAHVELTEIDLFAVANGPGSFTGLRIGIATVKGLAATLNCPCVGIPTLHAIAHSGGGSENTVALLPAGRSEVFAQLFAVTGEGVVTALDQASHIAPQKLFEKYGSLENLLWCGNGAIANKAFFEGNVRWRIAPSVENLAEHVSSLALARFRENQVEDPDALQALYVRPSDAELKVQ